MKVVTSIGSHKKRSKDCKLVHRKGRLYLLCKINPRMKVRQGRANKKLK